MTMRVVALSVLTSLAIACGGPPNSLEGSIGESFSLDFDRVAILKQDSALRIEYLKDTPGGTNKVCKLVVETSGLSLGDDSEIKGSTFSARVTVQRVSTSGGDFPEVKSGKISFEKYSFKAGGRIDGEFDVGFTNGRTLSGTFDGEVKVVSTE